MKFFNYTYNLNRSVFNDKHTRKCKYCCIIAFLTFVDEIFGLFSVLDIRGQIILNNKMVFQNCFEENVWLVISYILNRRFRPFDYFITKLHLSWAKGFHRFNINFFILQQKYHIYNCQYIQTKIQPDRISLCCILLNIGLCSLNINWIGIEKFVNNQLCIVGIGEKSTGQNNNP